MPYITVDDLAPFAEIEAEQAEAMIADATAQAIVAAPCLGTESDLDENQTAAVRSVLRSAILRWNDAGSGAFQYEAMGPFTVSHDTRQSRRSLFWPSELAQLEAVCKAVTGTTGTAFAVDTAPGFGTGHATTCALVFGAAYCSCGADIAGSPLYGA